MEILGYRLEKTCDACPEQYDVYCGVEHIGYLRLRHGTFRADYKGETEYVAYPKGDGAFEEDEREKYLTEAVRALHNKHLEEIEGMAVETCVREKLLEALEDIKLLAKTTLKEPYLLDDEEYKDNFIKSLIEALTLLKEL